MSSTSVVKQHKIYLSRRHREATVAELSDGTFDPRTPGESVDDVGLGLVELSRKENRTIPLVFNGIRVDITAADTAASILQRFHKGWDDRAAAYRASPEGQAAAAKRAAEISANQAKAGALLAQLKTMTPGDHKAALKWAVAYESAAGDAGVKVDHRAAADGLERLGYRRHENVLRDEASPQVKADIQHALTTAEGEARYIMGQVIDFLRMDMPPHGVVVSFVEKWMARNG